MEQKIVWVDFFLLRTENLNLGFSTIPALLCSYQLFLFLVKKVKPERFLLHCAVELEGLSEGSQSWGDGCTDGLIHGQMDVRTNGRKEFFLILQDFVYPFAVHPRGLRAIWWSPRPTRGVCGAARGV